MDALPKPAGGRRRFKPQELETLELRKVRPLVEIGQGSAVIQLEDPPRAVTVGLQWLERYGGTFGPKSSAEAAGRRFRSSHERFMAEDEPPPPERNADRGRVPAWIAYLTCPRCGKRCLRLRTPRRENAWACSRCLPQLSPRNIQQGRPESARQARRHRYWATRIRRDYMGFPADVAGELFFQPTARLPRPKGCRISRERWEALRRLAMAHETLWQIAEVSALPAALGGLKELRKLLTPTTSQRIEFQDSTRWAKAVLRIDRWALRQTSWHRCGRPRNPDKNRPQAD